MKINKSIFRAYDIRGVYPDDLNEEAALHIGKALGTFILSKYPDKMPTFVVGRDSRESSPALTQNLIKGISSTGSKVVDVGISLTPIIHFLTCTKDFDCGVEVTASHNPKEFNGFRIDYKNADPLHSEDILELYKLTQNENYSEGSGDVREEDLFGTYLDYLKNHFSFDKSIKVVVNCGYGTTSYFAEKIFTELGSNVETVFCTPRSDFPQGIPNPERDSFIEILEEEVLKHKADIGFTFDEDSDRFGVVDEKGNSYNNDRMLLFIAKDVLMNEPGGEVIYDIKSSNLVGELVKKWGGKPTMMKTGHTFFVEKMKYGAILGGEFSGHVYFGKDYFGYDDGIYAACRVLDILARRERPFSELMKDIPRRYSTDEIKIACDDEKKFGIVEEVTKEILSKKNEFSDVLTIDGVRVSVSNESWFLVRASNTSPYLSIRAEAKNKEDLKLMLEGLKDLLQKYKFLDLSVLKSV